jgi:hypothetical protein
LLAKLGIERSYVMLNTQQRLPRHLLRDVQGRPRQQDFPPEFEEAEIPKRPEEYGEATKHGTTEADHLHVSPEEAAKNTDEVEEQLPGEDPEFAEELEGADPMYAGAARPGSTRWPGPGGRPGSDSVDRRMPQAGVIVGQRPRRPWSGTKLTQDL